MQYHYARKRRQFFYKLKQLKKLIKNQSPTQIIEKFKSEIKSLFDCFPNTLKKQSLPFLSSILLLSNANQISAQTFKGGVNNPFGLEKHARSNYELVFGYDFADMNGDNLNDLIVFRLENDGSYNSYKFYYSENLNGQFDTIEHLIYEIPPTYTQSALLINNFSVVDLDDDGDNDLMAIGSDYYYAYGGSCASSFVFIENEGTIQAPSFNQHQIDPFGLSWPCKQELVSIDFGDLDNDGDQDILLSGRFKDISYYSYEDSIGLAYFENIGSDTVPLFGNFEVDPYNLEISNLPNSIYITSAYFDDFNNDSKLDVFGQAVIFTMDSVLYKDLVFFNNGSYNTPNFENYQLDVYDSLSVESVYLLPPTIGAFDKLADIDSDGDLDYIVSSTCRDNDEVYFCFKVFERISEITLSVSETVSPKLKMFPNPVANVLFLEGEEIKNIKIYDSKGQTIDVLSYSVAEDLLKINVKDLSKGIYIIEYSTPENTFSTKFIKQ